MQHLPLLSLLALLAAFGCGHVVAAPLLVRHALAQQQSARVITYELEVLQLLLDKTRPQDGDYRLLGSETVTQSRAFLQLAGGEIDVLSSMSSNEREARALPLRVCLYRGLLGVRLPIALASRRAALEPLRDAAAARQLQLGQVGDWPDTQILQQQGWRVQRMPRLSGFAELLRRGRIDAFPLGAIEVYPIADAQPDLAVLEQWALAYPSGFYFFVSPRRPELAERLRRGWELALADGSFVALFERRIGPQLARARLSQRHWFVLENPLLPALMPLQDARLWHPLVRERLILPLLSQRKPKP